MAVRQLCRHQSILLVCVRPFLKISRTFIDRNKLSNFNLSNLPNISLTDGKAGKLMETYENFVGLTEVKAAQNKVIESEKNFLNIQDQRRQKSLEVSGLQTELKQISLELEKTNRTDDRYLSLLTQEHAVIRKEATLADEIRNIEKSERESFSALSTSVRESHEKERAQAEKTKYWSVIGSIIGALLGIIGTNINNRMRMKELRSIVSKSTEDGEQQRALTENMMNALKSQLSSTGTFINELKKVLKSSATVTSATTLSSPEHLLMSNNAQVPDQSKDTYLINSSSQKLEEHTAELMSSIKRQEEYLTTELASIKQLLLLQKSRAATDFNDNIIYIGPEIDRHFENSNQKIEQKLKLHSLATVTLIYGAFALTLPVLYTIFRGN